jgi:hypothetical protein
MLDTLRSQNVADGVFQWFEGNEMHCTALQQYNMTDCQGIIHHPNF